MRFHTFPAPKPPKVEDEEKGNFQRRRLNIMLRKVFRRIVTSTKPGEEHSPTTLNGSSSVKTVQEETLDESADRVTQMMIENLRNPANHSAYREYPYPQDK